MLGKKISQLMQAGRYKETIALLNRAIAKSPKDARLWIALAQVHNRGTRDSTAALKACEKALKINSKLAVAHGECAQAFSDLRRDAQAVKSARRAILLSPKTAEFHHILATILYRTNQPNDAESSIQKALRLKPGMVPSRLLRANIQRSLGHLDVAKEICQGVFDDAPDNLNLYSAYCVIEKLTPEDPLMQYFISSVAPKYQNATGFPRVRINRILAKFHDDCGDPDKAFQLHIEAKTAEGVRHNGGAYANFVSTQIRSLTRPDYFGHSASDSEQPVLIVGMPRSGSTLMEQILEAHGKISGIGESDAVRWAFNALGARENDVADQISKIKSLPETKAAAIAAKFLDDIQEMAGGSPDRIVDKKLHNFELLGFFARLFPKARIIHATRDPMDCCVSCFTTNLNATHSYTRDLGNLGQYYKQYRRLMAHWKGNLPNPILDVAYEDMVADTEATARNVVSFLGLDWDANCMNYQTVDKQVRTISASQVRRPIYTSSIRKWTRYEAHLDPLKAELAPLYPDGFDNPSR